MQYHIGIKAQGTKYYGILSGNQGRHMQYDKVINGVYDNKEDPMLYLS